MSMILGGIIFLSLPVFILMVWDFISEVYEVSSGNRKSKFSALFFDFFKTIIYMLLGFIVALVVSAIFQKFISGTVISLFVFTSAWAFAIYKYISFRKLRKENSN